MHVGHFATALAGKRLAPRLSLGTLLFAAMLADFLWCVFMVAGIEHVQFQPGKGAARYIAVADFAVSHGLLTDLAWAALFTAAYVLMRHDRRGARWLFAAVLSHWVLDFVSLEVPLAPGIPGYFGLRLWESIPLTVVVEGGFWVVAIALYARATQPRGRAGVYAFWAVIPLLTLAWYNNIAGAPPPNPRAAPFASFTYFALVVAWAYWMNRARPARSA